jgi:ferric-dicitrate binding protein FerR (iron transport regulator)
MSNEQENTRIDELLARYLSAETTAAENAEAESWINASAENKKYFEGLKEIWNHAASPAAIQFDTNAAWNRMKTRMNVNEPASKISRPAYFRIAAGVALFILLGTSLFLLTQKEEQPKMKVLAWTPLQASNVDTLPDGSIITLNRNSQLTFPEYFNGETREVNLKGEMFFEIKPDAERPFIIHTGSLDIKVVGTSFNVNAFPETDSVRVSVTTGKVKCYVGKDTVVLVPGEIAVYNKKTRKLRKGREDDPNATAYRNRFFKFDNTRLSDAVRLLNNAYGSNIVIKSSVINDCGVNGTFNNRSLDFVLDIISATAGITIERNGNTIILDGKGCKK